MLDEEILQRYRVGKREYEEHYGTAVYARDVPGLRFLPGAGCLSPAPRAGAATGAIRNTGCGVKFQNFYNFSAYFA